MRCCYVVAIVKLATETTAAQPRNDSEAGKTRNTTDDQVVLNEVTTEQTAVQRPVAEQPAAKPPAAEQPATKPPDVKQSAALSNDMQLEIPVGLEETNKSEKEVASAVMSIPNGTQNNVVSRGQSDAGSRRQPYTHRAISRTQHGNELTQQTTLINSLTQHGYELTQPTTPINSLTQHGYELTQPTTLINSRHTPLQPTASAPASRHYSSNEHLLHDVDAPESHHSAYMPEAGRYRSLITVSYAGSEIVSDVTDNDWQTSAHLTSKPASFVVKHGTAARQPQRATRRAYISRSMSDVRQLSVAKVRRQYSLKHVQGQGPMRYSLKHVHGQGPIRYSLKNVQGQGTMRYSLKHVQGQGPMRYSLEVRQ